MNIFNIVISLIICAIFFISLRMNMSTDRSEERKLWIVSIALVVIFVGVSWWSTKIDNDSLMTMFVNLMYSFSYPVPKIIARFINDEERNRQPICQLSVSKSVIIKELIIIILLLFLTVFIFIPNQVSYTVTPDGETTVTYKSKFTPFTLSLAFLLLSHIVLSILNIGQKVKVIDSGLFYDGRFWKWSDFESYYLRKGSKEVVLTTNRKRSIWQIKLGLLPENKEKIINLLSQNLKVERNS